MARRRNPPELVRTKWELADRLRAIRTEMYGERGLALGLAGGFWLAKLAGSFIGGVKLPGVLPLVGSALVLLVAAVTASMIPALRAARVDVIQALRTE